MQAGLIDQQHRLADRAFLAARRHGEDMLEQAGKHLRTALAGVLSDRARQSGPAAGLGPSCRRAVHDLRIRGVEFGKPAAVPAPVADEPGLPRVPAGRGPPWIVWMANLASVGARPVAARKCAELKEPCLRLPEIPTTVVI